MSSPARTPEVGADLDPPPPARPAATPAQVQAITARGSDVCVCAGAGSGKTYVLTERFRGLVRDGVVPERILTITFTDKAAREMTERIGEALEGDGVLDARRVVEGAWISTIHGFCARLLRERALEAGVDPAFGVLTEVPAARARRAAFLQAQRELRAAHPGLYDALVDRVRWGKDRGGAASIRQRVLALYDEVRAAGGELRELPPGARVDAEALAEREVRLALEALAEAVSWLLGELRQVERPSAFLARRGAAVAELSARIAAAPLDRFRLEVYRDLAALAEAASCKGKLAEPFAAVRAAAQRAAGAYAEGPARALGRGLEDLLARFDRAFRAIKEAQAVLDFNDLEERTRRLLEGRPDVRDEVRSRFEAVLIDEFQDTSRLQQRLVELIRRPAALFVVGDVKQSIYGFRHADVRGLLDLEAEVTAAGGASISLDVSFRTRPELLAYASEVFERVFGESRGRPGAVPHQPLRAGVAYPPAAAPCVELVVGRGESLARARAEEARAVAARLATLIEEERVRGTNPLRADSFGRPLRYRDCAILLPATTALGTYERALRERGIPYRVSSGRGFYHAREVVDAVNLLAVTDAADDDLALLAFLRSPAAGLSDDAFAALAERRARLGRGASLLAALREATLAAEAGEGGLGPRDAGRARAALDLLDELRALRGRLRARDLLARALERSGLLDGSLLRGGDVRGFANLHKLLALVEELERDGVTGPGAVAEVFEDLRASDARESEANVSADDEDAVSLLTVHASKGLEWPLVVVADLGRRRPPFTDPVQWSPETGVTLDLRDPDGGGAITPAGLAALSERKRELQREESKRLLYVAMTRARDHLILAGAQGTQARTSGDWLTWARAPLDPTQPALGLERDDPAGGVARVVGTRGGVLVRSLEISEELAGTPIVGRRGPAAGAEPVLDAPQCEALARGADPGLPPVEPALVAQAEALLARIRAPELPDLDHGASVYSVSEVLAWHACPRQALYRYVIGDEASGRGWDDPGELGGESALWGGVPPEVRGTLVHEALAKAVARGGRLPSPTALTARLTQLAAPRDLAADAASRVVAHARRLTRDFLESPLGVAALEGGAARVEEPFLVALDVPAEGDDPGDGREREPFLLRGAIDLVFPRAGGVVLVDYKTTDITALEVPLHLAGPELQLQLYALGLRALGVPVVAARVVHLVPGVASPIDVGPAALDAARRLLGEFTAARRALDLPARPGSVCRSCPWRASCGAAERPARRPMRGGAGRALPTF